MTRMRKKLSIARVFGLLFKGLFLLVIIGIAMSIATPLWNRWVVYPRLEKEKHALQSRFKRPATMITLTDYSGALHCHSFWSHDSRGQLSEILPAAKAAGLDYIFFADHRRADLDSFPRSLDGTFDGITFVSGTESPGASMMVTPMKPAVINWELPRDSLIKKVVKDGGMVFYLHSEDADHNWGNPDYQGMEIYNIHTDLLDEKSPLKFLLNGAINSDQFRHWCYRELFDEQTEIMSRWDSLNRHRKIVGIGSVDAHNNQSIRAKMLSDGRVEWVGSNAKTIKIKNPGWLEKRMFGPPDSSGWVFKREFDTYFHSFNFVNTHVFSPRKDAQSLKESLVKGNAYIAFESLAPAKGFQFFAASTPDIPVAIMGDSLSITKARTIQATAPFPVRFELYRDGKLIDHRDDAYDFTFDLKSKKGNYRLVARLYFQDHWVPWIYTNPIYLF